MPRCISRPELNGPYGRDPNRFINGAPCFVKQKDSFHPALCMSGGHSIFLAFRKGGSSADTPGAWCITTNYYDAGDVELHVANNIGYLRSTQSSPTIQGLTWELLDGARWQVQNLIKVKCLEASVPVPAPLSITTAPQAAPAPQAPSGPQTPSLPPGWRIKYDPDSGRPYYVNDVTQETQWELPTAPAEPVVPTPPAPAEVNPVLPTGDDRTTEQTGFVTLRSPLFPSGTVVIALQGGKKRRLQMAASIIWTILTRRLTGNYRNPTAWKSKRRQKVPLKLFLLKWNKSTSHQVGFHYLYVGRHAEHDTNAQAGKRCLHQRVGCTTSITTQEHPIGSYLRTM